MTLTPARALLSLAALAVLFWAATGVALLLGSPDLGSAMTFGQIAFVAGAAAIMLKSR
jgi:hypothetical protein